MKLGIIVQARMGSKRLPGKVLKNYKNISPLGLLLDKIAYVGLRKSTIIATTKQKKDLKITNFCKQKKFNFFKGSEKDVLKRYYECSKKFRIKIIVRLTADCPFLDLFLLKKMIKTFKKNNYDYLSNTYPQPCKFPDGSDIEIFTFKALKEACLYARLPSEREHVTNYIYKTKNNRIKRIDIRKNLSNYRYTIDNKNDFKIFEKIIDKFSYKKIINLDYIKITNFLKKNKKITRYQKKIKRNYGWESSLKKDLKYKKINN